MSWGSNSTFLASNSKHPQKIRLFEPNMLNLDIWWFEIRPLWNYEVPHALGCQFHLQSLKFKTPTNFLAPSTKMAKFRYLLIWNHGPGGIMRTPHIGGSILPSNPQILYTHKKFWLLEPKRLNLEVWWFEIGAPVKLWVLPHVGGPIPPSKSQIQNTHKKIWLLEPKWLNLDVWWFEIGAQMELWGPPHVGGPILPSKRWMQNTYKKIWLLSQNV
jgi:hypothetical protein